MKIWKLKSDLERYDSLTTVYDCDLESLTFDGSSKKAGWKPIKVERMDPKKYSELGDAPGFDVPMFSERAVRILHPLIGKSVEELELDFDEKYYGINVIAILDVIDYKKSKYDTFSDGKKIMWFEKYAFRNVPELSEYDIFKIPDETRRDPFVSDRFKEAAEANGLRGFAFELVWDSEAKVTEEDTTATESANHDNTPKNPPENITVEDIFSIVRPLDNLEASKIKVYSLIGETLFKINHKDGAKAVEQIDHIVSDIIKAGSYPPVCRSYNDAAVELGYVLGWIVSEEYHWDWMAFGDESYLYYGVVSPHHLYAFAPVAYIYRLLTESDAENADVTVALLFNMLKEIEDNPANAGYRFIV